MKIERITTYPDGSTESLLKERSMLYQTDLKEYAAEVFGLPYDTYYHLPYELWKHVRQRLSEYEDCMCRDYEQVQEWFGEYLGNVPFNQWVHIYKEWLSSQ